MILFLISSSYIENTLITNLDYLLGIDISEIILLKENHIESEFSKITKIKITLFNSVDEAVNYSDMIIIIKPYGSENCKYESIVSKIQKKDKMYHFIDLNQLDTNSYNLNNNIEVETDVVPTIAIISIGQFNQIQNLELYLNRVFNEKNIRFYQEFSANSNILLNKFKKQKILNSKINNHINLKGYEIAFKTIITDSITGAIDDIELINSIHKMSPDFVILMCENNVKEFTDSLEFLQYRLNKRFDLILYSDYISVSWDDSNYPVLVTNNFNTNFNKNEHGKSIWQIIIDRIALPENIFIRRTSR